MESTDWQTFQFWLWTDFMQTPGLRRNFWAVLGNVTHTFISVTPVRCPERLWPRNVNKRCKDWKIRGRSMN
jgi:hypothetical protein